MNNIKLHKIVKSSIENVDFYQPYREIYECIEDFDKIPIISKPEVLNSSKSIISKSTPKKIITKWTSGTTGVPMRVEWSEKEYLESYWYLWQLRKNWYKILPTYKVCTFHTALSNGNKIVSKKVLISQNGRSMFLGRYTFDKDTLEYYIEAIDYFKPDWILGPPSILCIITEFLREQNKRIDSLKYIELNGEYVSASTIESLKEYYNVPVANLYGATEFNGIALSCPYGHMHILNNNVFVETENTISPSDIIVTGLVNSYMPLLRYNIGDRGIFQESLCLCGNKQELIVKYGRTQELINLNGINVDATLFNLFVDEINFETVVIKQYQVVIKSQLIQLLVLVDKSHNNYLNRIKNNHEYKLQSLLNNRFKVEICVINNYNSFYSGGNKFKNVVFE